MNFETAKEIYDGARRAIEELASVTEAIRRIEDLDLQKKVREQKAMLLGQIAYGLCFPLESMFPELWPTEEPGEPDTSLDERGIEAVSKLTAEDIVDIDRALLAQCISLSRKAARVVGTAMSEFDGRFRGIPDSFFLQRLISLADAGVIEFDGDLRYMRHSEVWLPANGMNVSVETDASKKIKTSIIVLTGASGAGKTTILSALEAMALDGVGCFYCDRNVVDGAKSSYPGDAQAAAFEYWVKHVGQLDLRVAVLETRISPHRALQVLGDLGVAGFEIVLVDCEPKKRNARLNGESNQPELATAQTDCRAAYLRGQADALGLLIIDTGVTPVRESAVKIANVAGEISTKK